MTLKRITVTHTASYVFDQDGVDAVWFNVGGLIPDYVRRGNEATDADERAITIYEALGDSLVDLFHPLQDDDTGYEIEDYDPDA